MINASQREKLKASWGEKAESMQCYAEVRVFDLSSAWECYIYALNPEDDDEVRCIVKVSRHAEACAIPWHLKDILSLYTQSGEGVEVDKEYRPMRTAELFKKLNEEKDGDSRN